ncbi:hypothetical protein PAMA_007743 [Pampus argenteus]
MITTITRGHCCLVHLLISGHLSAFHLLIAKEKDTRRRDSVKGIMLERRSIFKMLLEHPGSSCQNTGNFSRYSAGQDVTRVLSYHTVTGAQGADSGPTAATTAAFFLRLYDRQPTDPQPTGAKKKKGSTGVAFLTGGTPEVARGGGV